MTQLALRPRADSRLTVAASLAALLAAAAGSWLVLIGRMAGMDDGPGGDPGALGWFAVTWAAMTAAMMLPASAPVVLRLVRRGVRAGTSASAPVTTLAFLAGYGAVWMLAGLVGYALVQAVRDLHESALAWTSAGRYLAGATVAAAGLYQLTESKRRWLARCASSRPRLPGNAGALLAGVEHGGCCVACCWTLMAALYALGMMSVAWMAVLTFLIVGERLPPRPAIVVRAVAAALVVLGLAVAVTPAVVPGLPGLAARHGAQRMSMGPG